MPAVPAEPTCRMDDIASFRPGVQNGRPYTLDDLKALVANFQQFSTGPQPHYTPYVSINHDDGLAFGRIANATLKGDTLHLDADGVPMEVGAWRNQGKLQAPSIEFFEPKLDEAGNVLDGFRGPDGEVVTTPVLKCLTLLGNLPPAVKGLPPLPVAKFTHGGIVRKFAGETTMDRAAMLAALQAAGMDTTAITDAVPDEVLKAFLDAIQAKAANPDAAGDAGADAGAAVQQMSQGAGTVGAATATGGAPAVGVPGVGQHPSAITLKFTDANGRPATGTFISVEDANRQLNAFRANAAAIHRDQAKILADAKAAKVRAFKDEMCGTGGKKAFMTPAAFDAIEPMLLGCDDVVVRKFADGKTAGTSLAEAFARIKAANATPVRTFGDKLNDGTRAGTGGTPAVRPEVVEQALRATPEGRAALAARK